LIKDISLLDSNSTSNIIEARTGHACVVHLDKMFIIGGKSTSGILNDIHQTTAWDTSLVSNEPGFQKRHGHSAVVFNNEI